MANSTKMSAIGELELGRARPHNVPRNARFFFASDEWLFCERDAQGELHGAYRTYRADGTPELEFEYRHGKRHGPFRRYYPSGQIAHEGRYFDDLLDGLAITRSDGENTYSIRECCIPADARVMRQEHRRGQLLAEIFEDEHGRRLADPDGAPGAPGWPEPLREREEDVFGFAFDFWPARETRSLEPELDAGAEARVEQSLQVMCQTIQRCAQRFLALERALTPRAPPSLSTELCRFRALPELPLRRFSFETDGEEGKLTVHVNETLPGAAATRDLRAQLRIEWTALCWLCWAVGLDRVGLPTRIDSRPKLHAALLWASARQAALTGHEPKPSARDHFHGLDETRLPASALAHLAAHYREIRAVLLFASDAECQSLWQDDLGREPNAPEVCEETPLSPSDRASLPDARSD